MGRGGKHVALCRAGLLPAGEVDAKGQGRRIVLCREDGEKRKITTKDGVFCGAVDSGRNGKLLL